jgi:hypothetical protein
VRGDGHTPAALLATGALLAICRSTCSLNGPTREARLDEDVDRIVGHGVRQHVGQGVGAFVVQP